MGCKKLFIILMLIIIFSNSVYSISATGRVTLTILNSPPKIQNLSFSPEKPYEDASIICTASYIDENPSKVKLHYVWYVNNNLLSSQKTSILSQENFKTGDTITCQVTADDRIENSTPKIISTTILPTPLTTKLTKTGLTLVGSDLTSNQIQQTQKTQGFSAITGLAISEIKTNPQPITINILFLLLVILIIINLLLLRKHLKKKSKLPKQDFPFS